MPLSVNHVLVVTAATLTCVSCDSHNAADRGDNASLANTASAADQSDPIESAMSAAPRSISSDAAIVQAGADGTMKTLREGKNGWTCMPDNPATPGPDPSNGRWPGSAVSRLPPTRSGSCI